MSSPGGLEDTATLSVLLFCLLRGECLDLYVGVLRVCSLVGGCLGYLQTLRGRPSGLLLGLLQETATPRVLLVFW